MRFRITSITGEDVGARVGEVTVKLEDWLNSALSDGDFGHGLDQLTMFVVSVEDDLDLNRRYVPRESIRRIKDPYTGRSIRSLNLAGSVPPGELMEADFAKAIHIVSAALSDKVRERPARVPRGVEFDRLSHAVASTLSAYVPA